MADDVDIGLEAASRGAWAEAIAAFERALARKPDDIDALFNRGAALQALKRHEEAIKHGLRVCELEPNEPFSFTAMSVTFQRAGKIPEAEDAMARARMLEGRR